MHRGLPKPAKPARRRSPNQTRIQLIEQHLLLIQARFQLYTSRFRRTLHAITEELPTGLRDKLTRRWSGSEQHPKDKTGSRSFGGIMSATTTTISKRVLGDNM